MARWEVEVWFLLSVTLGICLAQTSQHELTPAERTAPGEEVYINLFPNIYGNNVTRRAFSLPAGAYNMWIDLDTTLPPGNLLRIFVYIHGFSSSSNDTQYLRLQIWRATDWFERRFMLVYQIRVAIRANPPTNGMLYLFRPKVRFALDYLDRIGWTNEGGVGPISFNYRQGYRSLHKEYDQSNMPEVNDVVQFNKMHPPIAHSIAIEVTPHSLGLTEDESSIPAGWIAFILFVCVVLVSLLTITPILVRNYGSSHVTSTTVPSKPDDEYDEIRMSTVHSVTVDGNETLQDNVMNINTASDDGYEFPVKEEDGDYSTLNPKQMDKSSNGTADGNETPQDKIINVDTATDDGYEFPVKEEGGDYSTLNPKQMDKSSNGTADGNKTPQDNIMNVATATDDGYKFPMREEDGGYSRLNPILMNKSSNVYVIPTPGIANELSN